MGELHLYIKVDILPDVQGGRQRGAPQVAYRETLSRPVTIDYTHKSRRARGTVRALKLEFEPLPGWVRVRERRRCGSIPEGVHPSVDRVSSHRRRAVFLPAFGDRFGARLIDGAYHEVDSNALTSRSPPAAFRELASKGAVKLSSRS